MIVDYIDAHPEIFGGPVDRDDSREYGDVHYVQLAVHDLKVMLADLIEEEG